MAYREDYQHLLIEKKDGIAVLKSSGSLNAVRISSVAKNCMPLVCVPVNIGDC